MRFEPYNSYRSASSIWFNLIPTPWTERRLKYLALLKSEKSASKSNPVGLENVSSWTGRFVMTASKFQSDGVSFKPGYLLFGKLRPYLAKVFLANENGTAVGDFHVLHPVKDMEPRYLQYTMLTKEFIGVVDGSTYGSKMPRAGWEFMADVGMPVPSLKEQQAIATFLDHETARIDTLIEKQQKLIALLKEKRQAVISHAVTKGLDPNAPMKQSGVEWLGDVPEDWRMARLKHVTTILDCKHLTADFVDDGVPLASIREVQSWYVDLSSAKQTTNEFFSRLTEGNRKPQPGDIIYSRNATVGQAALVSEDHPDFTMGQDVCLIRSDMGMLPGLLMYHFISGHMVNQLDCAMVGATFKRVNVEEIKNFWVVIPPIESQTELLVYLAEKTAKFDKLMGDAGSMIELLQERRTALISAAVTGKIDVRNHPSAREAA